MAQVLAANLAYLAQKVNIENIEPQLVTIYSLDGRLVKRIENANIVDVRDLNKGVYLINIDGVAKQLFVVNNTPKACNLFVIRNL